VIVPILFLAGCVATKIERMPGAIENMQYSPSNIEK